MANAHLRLKENHVASFESVLRYIIKCKKMWHIISLQGQVTHFFFSVEGKSLDIVKALLVVPCQAAPPTPTSRPA
jgi:hypothetical protein